MNYELSSKSNQFEYSEDTDDSTQSEKVVGGSTTTIMTSTNRNKFVNLKSAAEVDTSDSNKYNLLKNNTDDKLQDDLGESLATPIKKTFRELTPDEIREQLKDYVLVPKEQWDNIGKGIHVRYIDTNNKYHQGAYVNCAYSKNDKKYFQLENRRYAKRNAAGHFTWPLEYEKIKFLYKRQAPTSSVETNLIRKELSSKSHEIESLREEIFNESNARYELERKVNALAEELKKQKAILKKMIDNK